MKYGFTGSQKGTDRKTILDIFNSLHLKDSDLIITGACDGVDSQVSNLAKFFYPKVEQLILVPDDKSKVNQKVFENGNVIHMPKGTDYRYRNEQIIKNSDKLIAFWNGDKIHSGTYMTINIATKRNVPCAIVDIR